MGDPTAWLDKLDAAHKAATAGSWEVLGDEGIWASLVFGGTFVTLGDGVHPVDAAAIVAEHNAAPKLTAALRAVLALADTWITEAQAQGAATDLHFAGVCLRAAVAEAVS